MSGLKAQALYIGAAFAAIAAASSMAAAPAQPTPTAADWRAPDPAHTMVIDTNKGRIVVELLSDHRPGLRGSVGDAYTRPRL